jgi:type I restriction enzyme S subunit
MWPKVPLDQLGFVSRGKSRHRPRNDASLYGGEYPFIQTGDVKAADLWITSHSQTYNEKGLAQSKLWPENTLCITIAANIADTALLGYPACFPDSIIGFIADEEKCDVRFVKYYFHIVQEQMRMVSQGATQDNLNQDKLLSFDIPCPPVAVQRKIAEVLSNYGALIETNRRRIALLEESARLLYREWFVNLKFPNSQCTPISNGVPVDWNWRRLCDIGKQQREQVVPRDLTSATAYLSMEHMTPRSICLGEWGNADCITSAKLRFQPNDILFGRIRPYFHKIGFAQIVGVTSTDMIVVRANDEDLFPLILLAMATDEFIAHAVATSNGSKMPRADWKVLKNWVLLLPPSKLRKQFASIVHPMLAMITELTKTNLQLAQARNELLPKLMSGELRL